MVAFVLRRTNTGLTRSSYRSLNRSIAQDAWLMFDNHVTSLHDGGIETTSASTDETWLYDNDGVAVYAPTKRIDHSTPWCLDYDQGFIFMLVKQAPGTSPTSTGRLFRDSASENTFAVYRNSSDTSFAFIVNSSSQTISVNKNIFDGNLHSVILGWNAATDRRYIIIDGEESVGTNAFSSVSATGTVYLGGNASGTARSNLLHYAVAFNKYWDESAAAALSENPMAFLRPERKLYLLPSITSGDGSASGVATGSGVGASTVAADGSSSGAATATAVGSTVVATVTSNTVVFSSGDTAKIRLTAISGGSDETLVTKVDLDTLTKSDGTVPTYVSIIDIKWAIQNITRVALYFNHTTDDVIGHFSGSDIIKYGFIGGFTDPNTSGDTRGAATIGDILLSTFGASSGGTYDIALTLRLH